MKIIAFYISNHGFGHASRNIPIIEGLCKNNDDINIIVKTGKLQLEFMKQSLDLYNPKISFYECDNDVGLLLKEGSTEVDIKKLENKLKCFISNIDCRIVEESKFLKENKVNLVVSDIIFWIFEASKLSKIKSILISNFTWAEVYQNFGLYDLGNHFLNNYIKADKFLVYPLSTGIEQEFNKYETIGLASRVFNDENVERIKTLSSRPLVYISVGRSVSINKTIDVSCLNYTFIYTEGLNIVGENTIKLPVETLNTHEYIKASDFVITKAGWGTVSEAISAKKPMLVLQRNEVFEDRNTLNKLLDLNIALPILPEELNSQDIGRMLGELKEKKVNYNNLSSEFEESSDIISKKILEFV